MLVLPVAGPVHYALARRALPGASSKDRKDISLALVGAGLILLISMFAVLAEQLDWIHAEPGELHTRAWGMIMGAIVMVYANVVPKQAGSVRRMAAMRFCGWTLVIAGLLYSASWLLLPLQIARDGSTPVLAGGAALCLARLLLCRLNRVEPPASPV